MPDRVAVSRGNDMITTSEYAVTITIWILTLAGAFFGGRAAWRRRRLKPAGAQKQSSQRLYGD